MWPVIGGLISGLGSFLGTEQTNVQSAQNIALQNQENMAQQQQAEQFNAAQTQQQEQFQSGMVSQQEAFQQSMSNTAYQRASADMQKAGLNPMMMFGSGGPASSPSGASASGASASISPVHMAAPQYQSPLANVGDTVNKIVSNAVQMQTIDKMTQEIANMKTQQAKTEAETATEQMRPELVRAQTDKDTFARIAIQKAMPSIENSALTATNQMSMPEWLRTAADVGSYVGSKVDDTLSPVSSLLHGANSAKNLFSDRYGSMFR